MRPRWLDIGQVLFLCVYFRTETKSRSMNSQKKGTRQISSHLDLTNLVNKGFIIWLSGKFFLQDTAGCPEGARWLYLARSGSQSHRAIWFILPARGAGHVIKPVIIHQTHHEKSDWSRAFNQFTIACELDMINAISAADNAFIMSSSTSAWLLSPLECSPQKQNG